MDLLEMDSKETRIMKTDREGAAGSGSVMDEVRQRLDELRELLEENYITESEYAAAYANVLLEAGIDISAPPRAEPRRARRPAARSRRVGAGRSYERFALPALLIAGVLACSVFFCWMLEKGGLFAPRRNILPSSSLLPLSSVTAPNSADLVEAAAEAKPELEPEVEVEVEVKPEEAVSEESAVLGWAVVSAQKVRVRAAPDTSANNVLGWVLKGERFAVLKEAPGRDGSKWYNVRYEKIGEGWIEGWIKASMMKFEG
jgi:hypothetical protein